MKKKILALSLCMVLLLTACGADAVEKINSTVEDAIQESAPTPSPEPTPTPEPEEKVLSLNKSAKVGDWKFTVSKATTKKVIKKSDTWGFQPDKGNTYVVINLKVKNNGEEGAAFLPRIGYESTMMTAKLLFKDKYEYQPTELMGYDKDMCSISINPLATKKGILVFEVPKKIAKNLKKMKLRIGTTTDAVIYELKK